MAKWCLSEISFSYRLKCFWFVLFLVSLLLTIIAAITTFLVHAEFKEKTLAIIPNIAFFVGASIIGFSCSAIFSRKDYFLFRCVKDAVYLVDNRLRSHQIYELANPITKNALAGGGREVCGIRRQVVERRQDNIEKLDLDKAELYRLDDETSTFAVVSNIMFGVPDEETRVAIWEEKGATRIEDITKFDQWRPGYDLISVYYWPEGDRRKASKTFFDLGKKYLEEGNGYEDDKEKKRKKYESAKDHLEWAAYFNPTNCSAQESLRTAHEKLNPLHN